MISGTQTIFSSLSQNLIWSGDPASSGCFVFFGFKTTGSVLNATPFQLGRNCVPRVGI